MPRLTLRERYEAKIDRRSADECWPWTGATAKPRGSTEPGRPVIHRDGRAVQAARVGWELHVGDAPAADLCVLRSCRNVLCMNPAHWSLGPQPGPKQDLRERYASHVAQGAPDDCWPWTGATNGYRSHLDQDRPVIRMGRRTIAASRVGWELHAGAEVPEHLYVLHRCDNGKCMNPEHWFLGTPAANMADKVIKGRQVGGKRKTTPDQDEEIKHLLAAGMSQTAVAKRFGVSRIVVARVLRSWKSTQLKNFELDMSTGHAEAVLVDMADQTR